MAQPYILWKQGYESNNNDNEAQSFSLAALAQDWIDPGELLAVFLQNKFQQVDFRGENEGSLFAKCHVLEAEAVHTTCYCVCM